MKKWEDEQRKKAHMRRVIEAKPTLSMWCVCVIRFRDPGVADTAGID